MRSFPAPPGQGSRSFSPLNNEEGPRTFRGIPPIQGTRPALGCFSPLNNEEGPRTQSELAFIATSTWFQSSE